MTTDRRNSRGKSAREGCSRERQLEVEASKKSHGTQTPKFRPSSSPVESFLLVETTRSSIFLSIVRCIVEKSLEIFSRMPMDSISITILTSSSGIWVARMQSHRGSFLFSFIFRPFRVGYLRPEDLS